MSPIDQNWPLGPVARATAVPDDSRREPRKERRSAVGVGCVLGLNASEATSVSAPPARGKD